MPSTYDQPFKEQLDYFRSKGYALNPKQWDAVWQEANSGAFTVAKVAQMDILEDIKTALDDAMARGLTYQEFADGLIPTLTAKGWLGAASRLGNIFETNLAAAYNVGRWAQIQETADARPYLQYRGISDSRTRKTHRMQFGKVYQIGHAFWSMWYPPNGFRAVLPGQMIMTINGEIPIEQIKENYLVLTHTGEYNRVYEKMINVEETNAYHIELENGRLLKLTENHPVLCQRGWVYVEDLMESDTLFDVQKTCPVCNKTMQNKKKKFCSLKCLGVSNADKRTKHRFCISCGNEIPINRNAKKTKKNKFYCNQKCLGEGQRKNKPVCLHCGKQILADKSLSERTEIGNVVYFKTVTNERRFCSNHCYHAYKGATGIEETVKDWLFRRSIMFMFQGIVGKYTVDFLLPLLNIAVEVDGEYWHREGYRVEATLKKECVITQDFGLELIRITEKEIKANDFSRLERAIYAKPIKNKKNNETQLLRVRS